MTEPTPAGDYGTTRNRAASVSYAEIEAAARRLMLAGHYPSVGSVRKELKRGSTTTVADAMRRFWKDQAALNAGDPVALTRLPPEFADAAVELWEQALRLSQQTAMIDDNAARARLHDLRRDTEVKARSVELREKEWDLAARVRERALADTREHMNVLMKQLALGSAELRAHVARIADLESQVEGCRRQLATVIARAIAKNQSAVTTNPRKRPQPKPKKRALAKKRVRSRHPRRSPKR